MITSHVAYIIEMMPDCWYNTGDAQRWISSASNHVLMKCIRRDYSEVIGILLCLSKVFRVNIEATVWGFTGDVGIYI